jgi:signal peptidase I
MAEGAQVAGPVAGERRARAEKELTNLSESIQSLLVTVILALFGTCFVVQAFKIPSQSMEPTLLVGDHLLVNKFIFEGRGAWYEHVLPYRPIRRGDIIVFKFPYQDHTHYVKRVIGIPGDRIKIVDQRVYVNGELRNEPYVVHDASAYDAFGADFPPNDQFFVQGAVLREWADHIFQYVQKDELVVPSNHYFVMGDNRDHSWDSRYWGFVDRDAIMGRPVMIYWSLEDTGTDEDERDLRGRGHRLAAMLLLIRGRMLALADTLLHIPTRTRWGRMFHEVH